MPRRRYEGHEPTHDWQELHPRLVDPAQVTYEIIRPVLLGWETPKQRAQETGMPERTIYYKATLFDQAGMASLLPPEPPPAVPKLDKRSLPPLMQQAIVDLKAEYPAFTLHEIATICYAQFGRRPSPHTIQLTLASALHPSSKQRRYPAYAAIENPVQKRLAIIRLHMEGWSVKSIAGYLDISRQLVYRTLQRWIEEQFAGLPDKPPIPHHPARKVTMRDMQEVKKLQENPELGEYRMSAALEQMGIYLSPRTCGRILALNRDLYHLQLPSKGSAPKPKKEPPFKAEKRHHFWSVDIRYLDMHRLENEEMIYCISILENYSRAILASAITRRQDTQAYLSVLSTAIFNYGCPEALVSDSGMVFRSYQAMRIYDLLGIQKEQIEKGRPWQNYIETCFNVQRRMADWHFELAHTWEDLVAAHEKWLRDYNYQKHFAHEKREDGRHSPAEVLGWVSGRQFGLEYLHRTFSARYETRQLNKAGYARFRNFLLYAERGLAGKRALITLFQDSLTLEYGESTLARYSIEWQPDDYHLLSVGNPHLFEHPYHSRQLSLWSPSEVEWLVILPCQPSPRKRKRKQSQIIQLPLLFETDQTHQA
jgi:transposase InsO family protein